MPELPEVETVVRDLVAAGLQGRSVTSVEVHWPRTVGEPSVTAFRRRLNGRTIQSAHRRAKYICLTLDNGELLLIHLRMTGRLSITDGEGARLPHEHVIVGLDDGRTLRYHDTRKFGRWYLMADPERRLGDLGPEPFDPAYTGKVFSRDLRVRRRQLKPLLLDQTFIAGLGNIYVDEALWDAELHPAALADSVSQEDARLLHRAIRKVLKRGMRNLGTTLGTGNANFYSVGKRRGRNQDQLNVFRRTGEPCPRCGTTIERLVIGQRSTHICPECQRV